MAIVNRDDIDSFKPMIVDYLINKKGISNINKPFQCLNPNHDDQHPSMSYTDKYHICKCFSCGVSYDLFDLIALDYNANTFPEQLEIASKLYPNLDIDIYKKYDVIHSTNKNIDFTNYFKKCTNNITKTDYLVKRGIDSNLIKKYKIGYDEKRDMVIFPINKSSYFGRSVTGKDKIKSKGISYLWNEELLKDNSNSLIYITESIIDSLSLETINPNVKTVALNGLPNYKRLLNVIEENNYKGFLVLAFDADKTGFEYQKIVQEELTKINVNSFSNTLIRTIASETCKDLNEALVQNKEKLKRNFEYFDENYKLIIAKKIASKESECYEK